MSGVSGRRQGGWASRQAGRGVQVGDGREYEGTHLPPASGYEPSNLQVKPAGQRIFAIPPQNEGAGVGVDAEGSAGDEGNRRDEWETRANAAANSAKREIAKKGILGDILRFIYYNTPHNENS